MKKIKISPYRHLDLSDRVTIYSLKKLGKSSREISIATGRNVGAISRELRRNKSKANLEYFPVKAHDNFVKRALRQRTKAPHKNPEIYLYVREKLREEKWSPEEIAGRLKIDKPHLSICFETIYS
jgi:IS30 family transposase